MTIVTKSTIPAAPAPDMILPATTIPIEGEKPLQSVLMNWKNDNPLRDDKHHSASRKEDKVGGKKGAFYPINSTNPTKLEYRVRMSGPSNLFRISMNGYEESTYNWEACQIAQRISWK